LPAGDDATANAGQMPALQLIDDLQALIKIK
jgi:hypothetical protein